MIHHHKCNILKKYLSSIKSEKGDGISIVILGTCLMLMFIFASVNILNGKIIEERYNVLKDSVQSAAAGSVIHLLMDTSDTTVQQAKRVTDLKYDPYFQLALGYLVNDSPTSGGIYAKTGDINNFIKLDHKKVITSTLELISKTVLGGDKSLFSNNAINYNIIMFFIEPNYSSDYKQSFDLISYRSNDPYNGVVNTVEANNEEGLYINLQQAINDTVNRDNNGVTYNINLGANNDASELVRKMQTNPYYLVVVRDFALPTLFGNTKGNIFKDAFTSISGDGKLRTPICALQAGKIERKVN